MKKRTGGVIVLVVLGMGIAACDSTSEHASSTSTTTTVSVAPTSTQSRPSTTVAVSAKPPAPQHFTPSMVRAQGVTKQNKGGQSNIRFVAGSQSAKDIERMATECVKYFTKRTKAAFCYGYGTQADYDVKTPDWTPDFDAGIYGGSRPCWVVYVGQSLNAHEPTTGSGPNETEYAVSHCPGGVKF